jgi:WD40 repeat protein
VTRLQGIDQQWGPRLQTLEIGSGPVTSVAYSSDNQMITASSHYEIIIWESRTGAIWETLHTSSLISQLILSPDSKLMATVDQKGINLYDLGTFSIQKRFPHAQPQHFNSIAFSHDSKQLVICATEGLFMLNIDGDEAVLVQETHASPPLSAMFSFNDSPIISAHASSIIVWDAESKTVHSNLAAQGDEICDVKFANKSMLAASTHDSNFLCLWDALQGILVKRLHTTISTTTILFSPDDKLLISGHYDSTIRLWNVEQGTEIATYRGHVGSVTSLSFAGRDDLFISGGSDGQVRAWVVSPDLEDDHNPDKYPDSVKLEISHDSDHVFSFADDHILRIWDIEGGNPTRKIDFSPFTVDSKILISPDSSKFAFKTNEGYLRVWGLIDQNSEAQEISYNRYDMFGFSPDSKRVLYRDQTLSLSLWDIEKNETRKVAALDAKLQLGIATHLQYSPDGSLIVVAFSDNMYHGRVPRTLFVVKKASRIETTEVEFKPKVTFFLNVYQSKDLIISTNNMFCAVNESIAPWIVIVSVQTGLVLRRLSLHTTLSLISFSIDSSIVYTNFGFVFTDCSEIEAMQLPTKGIAQRYDPEEPSYENIIHGKVDFSLEVENGPGLLIKYDWLLYKDRRLLWLPPNYRPDFEDKILCGRTEGPNTVQNAEDAATAALTFLFRNAGMDMALMTIDPKLIGP